MGDNKAGTNDFHSKLFYYIPPTMIKNIEGYARKIRNLSQHDDDSIDRLNYVITTSILLAFSLLLFAKSYVGQPMQCWVPNQFSGPWEAYAEQYCFIENTYFVPMNETNLPAASSREDREMIYYQWVPFILVIMAMLFCAPRVFWAIYPSYSGLTIADMIMAARKSGEKLENVEKTMETLAREVRCRDDDRKSRIFDCYLIMKALILLNIFVQFFFLNFFLNTEYTFWGFGVFWDMIHGRHWQDSGHFPRVSFCDINVRELGNINHWTVQCVLMVNMFNEKIFIFLWFWFAFLLVVTALNFMTWMFRRFDRQSRMGLISDLLDQDGIVRSVEKEERLYKEVLKDDGVLFLRLLDSNSGRLHSGELIRTIWRISFAEESPEKSPISEDGEISTQTSNGSPNLLHFTENYPTHALLAEHEEMDA